MIIDYDQIPKLIESNLEIRISNESLNISKFKSNSLASTFIPEVSIYAQSEDSKIKKVGEEPTAGVIANVNIFNGLRDIEQVKINNLSYNTSKLELQKTYGEQVFLARKYYFEALKIKENLSILSEHEEVNKNNRNLILKKVLSPKSEELIFKKIELEIKEQKIKEENELKIVYSNLRKILSLQSSEKIEISGTIDSSKFTYDPGRKKIDLAIVESSESIAQSEKKMSGLWRMPRINLYAERSFTKHVNGEFLEENDEKQVLGVRLTLPIFSEKNIDSIEDQIAKTELLSAQLRKRKQLLENNLNDEKLELSLNHLRNMIEISKEKVSLSKNIMEKTFSEFRLGLKEALSLNEATEDYLEARKDLIEHQLEYIISIEEAKSGQIN